MANFGEVLETLRRADEAGSESSLPLRSLHTTFVTPVSAGTPLALRAESLRSGRSATHARCDLLQDGKVACTTTAIYCCSS